MEYSVSVGKMMKGAAWLTFWKQQYMNKVAAICMITVHVHLMGKSVYFDFR